MIASMTMVEISLLFFLALFVGIVVRLVFSRSKRWKEDARIPLDDSIAMQAEPHNTSEGVRK